MKAKLEQRYVLQDNVKKQLLSQSVRDPPSVNSSNCQRSPATNVESGMVTSKGVALRLKSHNRVFSHMQGRCNSFKGATGEIAFARASLHPGRRPDSNFPDCAWMGWRFALRRFNAPIIETIFQRPRRGFAFPASPAGPAPSSGQSASCNIPNRQAKRAEREMASAKRRG